MLKLSNITRFGALSIVVLYLLASFFPDSWMWGIHQLAFISIPVRLLLVGLSIFIINISYFPDVVRPISTFIEDLKINRASYLFLSGCIAIFSIFLFNHFRIATDIYGDSRTLLNAMSGHYYTIGDIFTLREAEPLTRFIHQTIATVVGISTQSAIAWGNIISGSVFIFIILIFTRTLNLPVFSKVLFLILAFSLGGMQLFFGYVEDYSYSFLAILIFLILGWQTLHGKNWLWLMVVVLLVGIRLHLVMVFMFPAFLYLWLWKFSNHKGKTKTIISPKSIVIALVSTLCIGLVVYIFYFHAYSYTTTEETERSAKIFLPLVNPLPEPHSYTLLSIGHLSDVIQVLLYDLSPGIVLILGVSFFLRKKLKWNNPQFIFLGLASFYSILFCLTANPLLSFVRDWDLFAFVGLPLLFFVLSIIKALSEKENVSQIISQVCWSSLALALLSCTIFYVNTDQSLVHARVRQAGRATFKNYYRGSSYMINVAEGKISDLKTQLQQREETIQSLLPYSGNQDYEMANLTSMAGKCALSIKDFSSAEKYFDLSLTYDSLNATALKSIAVCKLMQSNIAGASEVIDYYNLQINDPDINDAKALLLAGFTNYIRYLNSMGADSSMIRQRLESFYQAYTDTSR